MSSIVNIQEVQTLSQWPHSKYNSICDSGLYQWGMSQVTKEEDPVSLFPG
jgi:hypothetical protein